MGSTSATAVIDGRVVTDPWFDTKDGNPWATVLLAVDGQWHPKKQIRDPDMVCRVLWFGDDAMRVRDTIQKGMEISVTGVLSLACREDDGKMRHQVQVKPEAFYVRQRDRPERAKADAAHAAPAVSVDAHSRPEAGKRPAPPKTPAGNGVPPDRGLRDAVEW
ncbi:MAG: single-stranded DNA-binding protein [Chloroflexota bacterium]